MALVDTKISDGNDVALGSRGLTAWNGSGSGSVIAILKAIYARLRGGQATMANSLPVAIASNQTTLTVTDTGNLGMGTAFIITPDDDNDLATTTRGVYLFEAGKLTADLETEGENVEFLSLALGVFHPLRLTRVYETGTDSTVILGVA